MDEPKHQPSIQFLMVEFTTTDRFHCGTMFPMVKGFALEAGIQVRWIRFAMRAAVQFQSGEIGIGLGEPDLLALVDRARTVGATHVLFSHRPAPSLVQALEGLLPLPRLAFVPVGADEVSREEKGLLHLSPSFESLSAFFDIKIEGREAAQGIRMVEDIMPDYGWEAGNEAAAQARSLPFIFCGSECRYVRQVKNNPVFAEIDLSACSNLRGCSFCQGSPGDEGWQSDALALARRQLEAAQRTHPAWPEKPRYRIIGEQVFFELDDFSRLILELDLPPSEFLLDARADHIVRFAERFEKALQLLKGTGHILHMSLVGIENLSPAELARLNKGFGTATILECLEILLRFEKLYPETFELREYGGLSTILFTPWTSLEDLALNLALVQLFELEDLCGKLLTSRLRLYPELPLAFLARNDGLLIEHYEDKALNTALRNFYSEELPWRFKHPEVELVNRVTTRLVFDQSLQSDALYEEVQSWFRTLPLTNEVAAAGALIKVLRQKPELDSVAVLLEATSAFLQGDLEGAPLDEEESWGDIEALLPDANRMEALLMKMGLKGVWKMEPVAAAHRALLLAEAGERMPNLSFRRRRRSMSGKVVYEAFFGAEPREVDEANRLSAVMEDPDCSDEDKRRAAKRLGLLYGYPECCAQAFSRETLEAWTYNEWLHLWLRVSEPGPVPWQTSPFTHYGVYYVPCSLLCTKSVDLVDKLFGELGNRLPGKGINEIVAHNQNPVFFLLNRPGQLVELIPEGTPAEKFRYRAGRRGGDDPRLDSVLAGDNVIIEEGRISIYKGERLIEAFILDAYVWWLERAFHPRFWRLCAAQVLGKGSRKTGWGLARQRRQELNRAEELPVDRGASVEKEDSKAREPVSEMAGERNFQPRQMAVPSSLPSLARASISPELRRLSRLIKKSARIRFGGYQVMQSSVDPHERTFVVLENGRERIELIIGLKRAMKGFFITAGPFAICHRKETPLDSVAKVKALTMLAKYLETQFISANKAKSAPRNPLETSRK